MKPVTTVAARGVLNVLLIVAIDLNTNPSSAIAYKTLGIGYIPPIKLMMVHKITLMSLTCSFEP